MSQADATATRAFEIRNVLIDYCGRTITAELIEAMTERLVRNIETGPCAWAFKELGK